MCIQRALCLQLQNRTVVPAQQIGATSSLVPQSTRCHRLPSRSLFSGQIKSVTKTRRYCLWSVRTGYWVMWCAHPWAEQPQRFQWLPLVTSCSVPHGNMSPVDRRPKAVPKTMGWNSIMISLTVCCPFCFWTSVQELLLTFKYFLQQQHDS